MSSNVVVTRRNVFQRLGDSIKGILLGLLLIAVAWIVYRPLLGISLLIVAGGIAFGLKKVWRKAPGASVPSPALASGGTEPPPPV